MGTREWNVACRRLAPAAMAMGTGLVAMLAPDRAEACSCLPATVESSYNGSSDVATLTPLFGYRIGSERWYIAQITKPYKGCTDAGDIVLLSTPSSSASCGTRLELGVEYLVNGDRRGSLFGVPKLAIGGCDYNLPVSELSDPDRGFLAGRQVCCGRDCDCADGSEPVQCFADPCQVAPACSEAATCEANYCGGCSAEFYDASGYGVCQAEGECASDADCPDGEWCRQSGGGAVDPNYECVPFMSEGDSCEGFTLPEFFERCAPGLVCDTVEFIADAPGVCRAPCGCDEECEAGEYCATDGTCDPDGQCELALDCNLEGNSFVHPECVGYGTCEPFEGCGWTCGDVSCVDLLGNDFGDCDAVLGWGVHGGICQELSGCSSPVALFDSQAACESACLPAPPGGCTSDEQCFPTGCSGEVCADQPRITSCEFRPEYACLQDPAVTTCGCNDGACMFARTPELDACLTEVRTAPAGN